MSSQLALIGAYQAANALTAAGLAIATGGGIAQTLANLARVQPVRGRLERAVISRRGRAGLCRLCAHARRDRIGDRGAAAACQRPADHRLRRRRRPRHRQARRDGRGRGAARRHGDRHRRQSEERGSGRDPARHPGGRAGRDRGGRAARGDPRGDRRGRARATSSCSPARATSRARSSATACCPSTTSRWRGRRRHELLPFPHKPPFVPSEVEGRWRRLITYAPHFLGTNEWGA